MNSEVDVDVITTVVVSVVELGAEPVVVTTELEVQTLVELVVIGDVID